jgi:hypothetical protein
LATVLSVFYMVILERWNGAVSDEFRALLKEMHELTRAVAALRRSEHREARLKVQARRLELDLERMELAWKKKELRAMATAARRRPAKRSESSLHRHSIETILHGASRRAASGEVHAAQDDLLASIEAHFERHFNEVESPSSEAVEDPVSPAVPLVPVAASQAGKIHESNQVQPIAYFRDGGTAQPPTYYMGTSAGRPTWSAPDSGVGGFKRSAPPRVAAA